MGNNEKKIKIELEKIVNTIKMTIPIEKIILFGSYAKETQKSESDIDLCIIINGKKNIQLLWKIREALFDITAYSIDLLLFNNEEFQDRGKSEASLEYEINKTGLLLYG